MELQEEIALPAPEASLREAPASGVAARRPLAAVGIGPDGERVYRALLVRPSATAQSLASALDLPPARLAAALSSLQQGGLVSRLPGRPARFLAAAPELALECLVRGAEEELQRVRAVADRLADDLGRASRRRHPAQIVETVGGRDAVALWELQLRGAATREILLLDGAPAALEPERRAAAELERLRAGVRHRTVCAAAAPAASGRHEQLARFARAGGRARLVPELPLRLLIADRRVALLPRDGAGALVVHPSPLLDGLCLLFESTWERARPLEASGDVPSEEDRQVLALMVSGLKDEAVAYRLGLSPRTLRRRVERLMRALGADTRFQAGYRARQRGWL